MHLEFLRLSVKHYDILFVLNSMDGYRSEWFALAMGSLDISILYINIVLDWKTYEGCLRRFFVIECLENLCNIMLFSCRGLGILYFVSLGCRDVRVESLYFILVIDLAAGC